MSIDLTTFRQYYAPRGPVDRRGRQGWPGRTAHTQHGEPGQAAGDRPWRKSSIWRLKNLTAYRGISQGEVLDLALEALEKALVVTLDEKLQDAYFDGKLRNDGTVVK